MRTTASASTRASIASCQRRSRICIVESISPANSHADVNDLSSEAGISGFPELFVNAHLEPQISTVLVFLRASDLVGDVMLSSLQGKIDAEPAFEKKRSPILIF